MSTSTTTTYRTHNCGQLRAAHFGERVSLAGWVDSFRHHGEGLVFIDLRDREGVTQLVFDRESASPDVVELARSLRSEDVVAVTGQARKRDGGANPRLATGEIEVDAQEARVLNRAVDLPFSPTDPDSLPGEEIRLRRRYLDLRRPAMQRIMRTRHTITQAIRSFLSARTFTEVETPILCKSTPEGARDFLVPSRLQPSCFYALPQSPQIFKQILMVSGVDRYFQIARCFRDEDPRADRQAEFTQLDLEMSFVGRNDVMALVASLFQEIWRSALEVEIGDIPRISYAEAMDRYGSDKPDTRFDMELVDVSTIMRDTGFRVFTGALDAGGVVKAIRAPGAASRTTRKQADAYAAFVQQFGAGGLPYIKVEEGGFTTGVSKFLAPVEAALRDALGLETGDMVYFGADQPAVVARALGELRLQLARDLDMIPEWGKQWNFLWVVNFPLVQWNEDEQRWDSLHHPFTAPDPSQLDTLETDPGAVGSLAYDLVLNGSEVAGGSVRIHDTNVQQRIFNLLGIGEQEARDKFGFLLDALKHGAPPHGGIAVGVDRVVMHICNTTNIRDVIAFPKTQTGADLLSEAPGEVDAAQLRELGIRLAQSTADSARRAGEPVG